MSLTVCQSFWKSEEDGLLFSREHSIQYVQNAMTTANSLFYI